MRAMRGARILALALACLGLLAAAGCSDDGEPARADGTQSLSDGSAQLDSGGPGSEAGGSGDSMVNFGDGAPPPGCDKSCTDFYDYLCVKDPSSGACKSCLQDKHCQANPRADGPFCDTTAKLCVCKVAADCANRTTGSKCLKVGNFFMCTCDTDADCTAPYTICEGVLIKRCVKPCTSNADCKKGGMTGTCDTKTGECSYPNI